MSMDFPSSPVNGQTTNDGRYYFDSSVGSSGAWRSTPLPVGGLPAGSIMAWGTNTPPANWLIADGSAVSRSVYSSLFAVIGTQYGAGNGTTTFNLPDLRGRVPVGRNGGTFGTLGATGGAESVTLTAAQSGVPAHSHSSQVWSIGYTSGPFNVLRSSALDNVYTNGAQTISTTTNTAADASQAHNNLQPYQVVNYIIKASAGWTAGDSELATRLGVVEAQAKGIIATTSGGTNGRGYFKATASTTISSGTVDPAGFSMTFNAQSGRLYRFSLSGYMDAATNSARYDMRLLDASNTTLAFFQDQVNASWARKSFYHDYIFTGSGSTTLKLRINHVESTLYFGGTPFNSAQAPSMTIEDIGPA